MIPKILAIGMIIAFTGLLLSEMGYKGKRSFAALSSVLLLTSLADELYGIFSEIYRIAEDGGAAEVARSALRVIGLGYVFGISADIAEELGETGVSRALGTVGRVEIFGLTLPYAKKILELGVSLIK